MKDDRNSTAMRRETCEISRREERTAVIGATTVGTRETGPPTFRLGDQQCIGAPNFVAVVFKKQDISQQVVARMQDLASEFSKIFLGRCPRTPTAGGGDPLPHPTPNTQRGLWPGAGRKRAPRPGVGTKPWSLSTFQPWLQP